MDYYCRKVNDKFFDFRESLDCFSNDCLFDKNETVYKLTISQTSILSAQLVGYVRFSDNKIICLANNKYELSNMIEIDEIAGRLVYYTIDSEERFLCI